MKNYTYFLLFWCVIGAASCKITQTSSNTLTSYTENLSAYRIIFEDKNTEQKNTSSSTGHPTAVKENPNNVQKNTTTSLQEASAAPNNHQNTEMIAFVNQLNEANLSIDNAQGFRIQVYSGNDRLKAEKMVAEVNTYLRRNGINEVAQFKYEQPNFKVKVGNYFVRLNAYGDYIALKKEYPDALIVSDVISLEDIRKKYK